MFVTFEKFRHFCPAKQHEDAVLLERT